MGFGKTDRLGLVSMFLGLAFLFLPAFAQGQEAEILSAGPLGSSAERLQAWADQVLDSPLKREATAREERREWEPDSIVILSETRLHVSADGTFEETQWTLEKVLTQDAAQSAGEVSAEWSPWRSDAPRMKARVINDGMAQHEHDQSEAFEQAASDGTDAVHTEDRRLTLLLDGVEKGSLVEKVIVTRTRPLIDGVQGTRFPLTDFLPPRILRLVLSSDAETPLSIRELGIQERVETGTLEGTEGWSRTYRLDDPVGVFDDYHANTGPDQVGYPMVEVVLPGNWTQLAAHYSAEVQKALAAGSDVAAAQMNAMPETVRQSDKRSQIDWCKQRIHRLVRYTGVEFGANAIFPHSPDVVIRRRFGDCKDQASLMVAMLKQLDIDAYVGLLDVTGGLDAPVDAATLDFFDHAIVRVPELDLWIDLTAEEIPLGQIPGSDLGRRCLVCRPENGSLETIQSSTAIGSRYQEVHHWCSGFSGGGQVVVQLQAEGAAGIQLIQSYKDQDKSTISRGWKDYFESEVGTSEVTFLQWGAEGADRFSLVTYGPPLQLFDRRKLRVYLQWDGQELLEELPSFLVFETDPATGNYLPMPERKLPVVMTVPSDYQLEKRFYFPATMKAGEVPEDWEIGNEVVTIGAHYVMETARDHWRTMGLDQETTRVIGEPDAEFESWVTCLDQVPKVQFQIAVRPGTLTVPEANQLIRQVNGWLEEDENPFFGTLTLDWATLNALDDHPGDESLAALVEESRRYQPLLDPEMALMHHLSGWGLERFATDRVAETSPTMELNSISRRWVNEVLFPELDDFQPVVTSAQRKLLQRFEEYVQGRYPGNLQSVGLLLHETGRQLTTDPEKCREAAQRLDEMLLQPDEHLPSESAVFTAQIWRMYVALLLKDDQRMLELVRQTELRPYQPIEALLQGEALETKRRNEWFDRLTWQMLASAGRWDLAEPLIAVQTKGSFLAGRQLRLDTLPEFDPTSAESVGRHLIAAIMAKEEKRVEEMLGRKLRQREIPVMVSEMDELLQEDDEREFAKGIYNRAVLEDAVMNWPVKREDLHQDLCFLRFRNSEDDHPNSAVLPLTLLLARDPDSGHWKPALSSEDALRLIKRNWVDGHRELVGAWLEDQVGPTGFLRMFTSRGQAPLQRFRSRLGSDHPHLIALSILFESARELKTAEDRQMLQEYLSDNQIALTESQQRLVDEVLDEEDDSFEAMETRFAVESKLLQQTPNATLALALLPTVRYLEFGGREIHNQKNWREIFERTLESGEMSSDQRLVLESGMALLAGDPVAAVSRLRDHQDDFEDPDRMWNQLLWLSLLGDQDLAQLRDDYESGIQNTEADDRSSAFQHTLACVEARLGMHQTALITLQEFDGQFDAGDDLVRALILESMGYDAFARQYFQQAIDKDQWTDTAVIARKALQRIDSKQSVELPAEPPPARSPQSDLPPSRTEQTVGQ